MNLRVSVEMNVL